MLPNTCIKSVYVTYSDYGAYRAGDRFYAVIVKDKILGLEQTYKRAKDVFTYYKFNMVDNITSSAQFDNDRKAIVFTAEEVGYTPTYSNWSNEPYFVAPRKTTKRIIFEWNPR